MTVNRLGDERPPLMTPREVAALFRVKVKTLQVWERRGRLHATRTPGNHRRYYRDEVEELLLGKVAEQTKSGSWTLGSWT